MEENENEKEAESGKEKEKGEKKQKKKDKVKETKNPQKTKNSTKKDCKRNFHLPYYNNTAAGYTHLDALKPADVFIFAEKNLEVSINKIDAVSDTKRFEENEHENSDEEEEDKAKIPPPHSPKKKGLDICQP